MVVVKYPNEDNLTPLKTIERNIADMEFFKEPFIVLQGLYVEQFESIEKKAEEKGLDIYSLVEMVDSSTGKSQEDTTENTESLIKIKKEIPAETLDKLGDNVEAVKSIVEEFDEDELQQISENKDKVLEVLDDLIASQDETKESLVRQTIGYIGELIYEHYLKNQGKESDYAAIRGVGEYDFHNKTDKTYVDVKTTIYSLKDGTAPFYLHRTQNVFMQQHPDEQYRIVRISLKDLNLQQSYERIRDIYGKDANPFENERLQKECQKLAAKYWRAAKIEEFDAVSPEYSIRIEKKLEK